jgi:hypothetical protein
MAINPYFPASYAGYQNPYTMQMMQNQYAQMQQPTTQQQQSGGLIWVQGLEGAKSYPVGAGQSVLLMDSESNCFFIKSADASGMPLPLRVFDYTERNTSQNVQKSTVSAGIDVSGFVTREEFEARIAQICGSQAHIEKEGANDGK